MWLVYVVDVKFAHYKTMTESIPHEINPPQMPDLFPCIYYVSRIKYIRVCVCVSPSIGYTISFTRIPRTFLAYSIMRLL